MQVKNPTLEDLQKIIEEFDWDYNISLGVLVAARGAYAAKGVNQASFSARKVEFLSQFLTRRSFGETTVFVVNRGGEICAEAVAQLLNFAPSPYPVYRYKHGREEVPSFGTLVEYLGENPPLEGLQGKVREFFRSFVERKPFGIPLEEHALAYGVDLASLARALLRYKVDSCLESLVDWHCYDAIPALFEAAGENLRGHLGHDKNDLLLPVVRFGRERVGEALGFSPDSRPLRWLVELSQKYLERYGCPYPLPTELLKKEDC